MEQADNEYKLLKKEGGLWNAPSEQEEKILVFEDNSGALEIATAHKFRPRTRHIDVKYHFFRDYYINRKEISIHPVDTTMQQADYLTKAVGLDILKRLRFMVVGW
jgi:hypothetical protein